MRFVGTHRFRQLIVVGAVFSCLFAVQDVHAFGKRRVLTKKNNKTKESQAYPVRDASIGKLYDAQFYLPDGRTRVDSGLALQEILLTEIPRATTKLRTNGLEQESGDSDAPKQRFVIRGGITAFEANLSEWGLKFGYHRGVGDIGEGSAVGLDGEVKVTVGRLEVDFYIFDKVRREIVGVGSGDARLLGLNLNVTASFNDLETGLDFVRQQKIATIFRSVVREAVKNLMKDPRTNFLMDWESTVASVDTDTRMLTFAGGARDEIKVGDLFEIYSGHFPIGTVVVNSVARDHSRASYKDDPSNGSLRETREGDRVLIFFKGAPH